MLLRVLMVVKYGFHWMLMALDNSMLDTREKKTAT